jgi:hypothetical protein
LAGSTVSKRTVFSEPRTTCPVGKGDQRVEQAAVPIDGADGIDVIGQLARIHAKLLT